MSARQPKRADKVALDERVARSMYAVRNGADVYDYQLATDLRFVERIHPQWINIGRPEMAPADGAKRQPYFGAILTRSGLSAARRALRRAEPKKGAA